MFLIEAILGKSNPYLGVFTYMVYPALLLFGLLLMPAGAYLERRRRVKFGELPPYPQIDLNDSRTRAIFFFIIASAVVLLGLISTVSYRAYQFTDSVAFCGELCHSVMNPEYTAYQASPHSRVTCAECHVGPGATWYVRSKLAGAYQIYSVLFHKYPRPIPTPIENLRPAQETCEQCHWPQHFFNEKQHENSYFLSDEHNTKWNLNLLMRIGGGNSEAGPTSGIHWHMNIANEVTYAPLDTQRMVIPWVKVKNREGIERVYRSTEIEVTDEELASIPTRRMDCIDCHNRPTHIYHPPAQSVNHVMALGWIDPGLPSIKGIAVEALERLYTTKKVALDSIKTIVTEYYQQNYPDMVTAKAPAIERAITELQTIYKRNYFPEMQASWKQFTNNIGHLYYPGCFRCHDGKHVSDDGTVLSKDCNLCHTILAQQFEKDKLRLSLGGIDYRHPVDIGDAWKEMNCSDCHSNQ